MRLALLPAQTINPDISWGFVARFLQDFWQQADIILRILPIAYLGEREYSGVGVIKV